MTLTKPEKDQIKKLEDRLAAIEKKLDRVKGIAVGIAIGGGLFGVKSIAEFISLLLK